MARLIRDLESRLAIFYAWQHGTGSTRQQPREKEHLQLPGQGSLDFRPIARALADTQFQGFVEIFMHPFPRGLSIMPKAAEVADVIARARDYFDQCLTAEPSAQP
jgi:sugar phosphate isomerase/epimerase